MKRALLPLLISLLVVVDGNSQNSTGNFGSKFFNDLRTLFGGLEQSELERAFQQSKAIECSDLIGQAGEWKQVAFLNDNRAFGNWHYDSIQEVQRDLVKFVFSGTCEVSGGGLKVATSYPVVETVRKFRAGLIPFSEIVLRNNNAVSVTFNRLTQAYTFELPYLYVEQNGLSRSTYSLQPPLLNSKPERSVKAEFSCKALSGPELTYRFLLCRANVFTNRAYYILSDGREARSDVKLIFADAPVVSGLNPELPSRSDPEPSSIVPRPGNDSAAADVLQRQSDAVKQLVPALVGKSIYAVAASKVFPSSALNGGNPGEPIPDVALLTRFRVTGLRFSDSHQLWLTVSSPKRQVGLIPTGFGLSDIGKLPTFAQLVPNWLTEMPPLTQREISAIEHRALFIGMTRAGVEIMFGRPEAVRDYGGGRSESVYRDGTLVIRFETGSNSSSFTRIDPAPKVVSWIVNKRQ